MENQKKPLNIFITGIAGFIGSHLASFLRNRGEYVIGCDNFNDYYNPNLKKARALELKKQGIDVLDCDIHDISRLYPLFEKTSFTHLVHLAAQAGVRSEKISHFQYAETNLIGFMHILELCRKYPSLSLVYASSSSIYGANEKIPFSEKDQTDRPVSFYGATKKSGELIAHAYHTLYGIPVTGLRYFTVYGPWGRPDMAYFSFASSILEGKPISVYNHGKMKRDFTYITDIVKGTAAAIDYGGKCEIFNLGNSHTEELMTLITLLEENLKKKAIIEFKPMQLGDVLETCADINKARDLLGFSPTISLEEGISLFVQWFGEMPLLKSR